MTFACGLTLGVRQPPITHRLREAAGLVLLSRTYSLASPPSEGTWSLCLPPPEPPPWGQLAAVLGRRSLSETVTLSSLNEKAAQISSVMRRSLLNSKELAHFLNPREPIEFSRTESLGAGRFREVGLYEVSSGPVAIKTTHTMPSEAEPSELWQWFSQVTNEFEIGLAVDHPNVMKVYHLAFKNVQEKLHAHTICEYVPGLTLHEFQQRSGAEIVRILNQLQATLGDMRAIKIWADDFHLHNAIVTPDNILKFIDLEHWRHATHPRTGHKRFYDGPCTQL